MEFLIIFGKFGTKIDDSEITQFSGFGGGGWGFPLATPLIRTFQFDKFPDLILLPPIPPNMEQPWTCRWHQGERTAGEGKRPWKGSFGLWDKNQLVNDALSKMSPFAGRHERAAGPGDVLGMRTCTPITALIYLIKGKTGLSVSRMQKKEHSLN